MKKRYDYLIVGAGLYGSTFARLAADRGKSCLVIDRRPHVGGNLYCENISGINVHCYGPHIFHTSSERVWKFVNEIVPFRNFINSPVAVAPDGNLYNLPFNMNTFYKLWGVTKPAEAMAMIESQRREAIDRLRSCGVEMPRNLEEQALTLVGSDIFEKLIRGYTEKQWGRPCSELPAFIIRRLPIRLSFDNNYFNDRYQGVPEGGYNRLIDGLLKGVDVRVNTDFFSDREYWESMADRIVFTGRIDEFFGFSLGVLQYRSLRFEKEILNLPNYQGNAVVNYTSSEVPFTRVIEHKHFESSGDTVYDNPVTVITKEYPSEWSDGMEAYYPINDRQNQDLYNNYRALASEKAPSVIFGGRLAEYKYYDMAPIIEKLLDYEFE